MPSLIELPDLDANIALCRRLGLGMVELNMNSPLASPGSVRPEQLSQATRDCGMGFSLHLPEELDLANFQPEIRRGHVECVLNTIAWARHADVRLLNMHLSGGVYFSLPDRKAWIYGQHSELFRANLLESFGVVAGAADQAGCTLSIENTAHWSLPFVRDALEMLLERHAAVGLTWDIGHDAKAGMAHREIIRKYRDRIRHLHLHGSDDRSDHQPLLEMTPPLPEALELMQSRGLSAIVETKTAAALEQSVAFLAAER